MTTKLKICGITRLEDARYAAAAGADYLGFVQYEASPRYVAARHVREIADWVHGPQPVGVFVDATAEEINRIADEAGFAFVQLHGDEPIFEVARVERPVIKALRVAPETSPEMLRRRLREYEDVADYFMLDTHSEQLRGGTGVPFDWDVARGLSDDYEVFLAGGIGAGNVEACVRAVHPFAVDVSSSLESAPGVKDFSRIDAFMNSFEALRVGL
jgi:phosphoribosylanthranilate isomerase